MSAIDIDDVDWVYGLPFLTSPLAALQIEKKGTIGRKKDE